MSADIPVSIIFQARDETGGAISSLRSQMGDIVQSTGSAVDATDDYSTALRQQAPILKEQRQLNRLNTFAFREQHEVLFTSISLASTIGRSAMKLVHIYTAYNTMQLRVTEQEEALNEARKDSADALAKYGPKSSQYLNAIKREQKETKKLEAIQQESQIQMLTYGVAALSMASDFTTAWQQINRLKFGLAKRGGIGNIFGGRGAAANIRGPGAAGGALSNLLPAAGGAGGLALGSLVVSAAAVTLVVGGVAAISQALRAQFPEKDLPVGLGGISGQNRLLEMATGSKGDIFGWGAGMEEFFGKMFGIAPSGAGAGGTTVNGDVNVYGASDLQGIAEEAQRVVQIRTKMTPPV